MFSAFVQSQFANIDQEERTAETITKRHALGFKQVAFLIESLEAIENPLEDKWVERRKYCLFKAGDIVKNLKAGVQPKRGNPKVDSGERIIPEESKDEVVDEDESEIGFNSGPNIPRTSETLPSTEKTRVLGGLELAKKHMIDAVSNLEYNQDTYAAYEIQRALDILRN